MDDAHPTESPPAAEAHFTAEYEAAAPRIWTWVAVRLGPKLRSVVDTEDLLQDVACRAWRRYSSFDAERGSFDAWLLGIARNTLGEVLARVARRRDSDEAWSTGAWGEVPDSATRVTERVARAEHLEQLVAWVDGLDEADRRLVVYRGLEGWPHADVAELVGATEDATKKRWERLVERLRDQPRVAALFGVTD